MRNDVRPMRGTLLAVVVVAVSGFLLFFKPPLDRSTSAAEILQSSGELKWFRGNLHTHSLWSDGDDYPEMIAQWYKDHGYDFLAFSDHNTLLEGDRWTDVSKNAGGEPAYDKLKARFPNGWVDERTTDGRLEVRLKRFAEITKRIGVPHEFLLIQSEEISDRFGRAAVHLNATNVQELIPPMGGASVYETLQNNVDAVIAQRERTGQPILVHVNHPNYLYSLTAEDMLRVRGENFFEVYNGHTKVANSGDDLHAGTERIWDIMLTKRLAEIGLPLMYGMGTDDSHDYHNIPSRAKEPGRGWVTVLARELSAEAIIDAMEQGRFYASSGVTLEKVVSSERGLEVEIQTEPEVTFTIEFIGTRAGYDANSEPVRDAEGNPIRATRRYSSEIGAVFEKVEGTKASYQFAGDEIYVRARVTSSKLHPNPSELGEFERAWVQPVKGPAAPKFD
jgi:hypothetical protein